MRTIFASLDRSNKWAASTADTIAPSSADKSQNSSVTRNLRARLKKAAGFLEALTAMTCRSGSVSGSGSGSGNCNGNVSVVGDVVVVVGLVVSVVV